MVIGVLHHLVDGVLEVRNNGVVVSDNLTIGLDSFLDKTLSDTQVFDHEAKTCVHTVVLSETLVHFLDLNTQRQDLSLFRSDISPQVLDFLV